MHCLLGKVALDAHFMLSWRDSLMWYLPTCLSEVNWHQPSWCLLSQLAAVYSLGWIISLSTLLLMGTVDVHCCAQGCACGAIQQERDYHCLLGLWSVLGQSCVAKQEGTPDWPHQGELWWLITSVVIQKTQRLASLLLDLKDIVGPWQH